MNKNKIIFLIIGAIFLALILLLVTKLNSESAPKTTVQSWDFSIWIFGDSSSDFNNFLSGFKEAFPSYANKNIIVESFSDRQTYTNALTNAVFSKQAPDIFMLNNSETSIFENQILWISPELVSPNDFRLKFKPVFWEDLIVTDEADQTVEFLKWVPAWYEALGIFYNRKYFLRPSEMQTWSDFAKEIRNISNKYSNIIPIALWNGSGVSRVADIISALIVLEWRSSLITTEANQSRQVLAMYNWFGQRDGDNRYNILSAPFVDDKDIDFFTQGDVAAMIWYPRDLLAIDSVWYQKSFLFATPFPRYAWSENRTSINYDYFSINKDTIHKDMAWAFLSYLASDEWQQLYVDTFPYYLSPNVDISLSMSEKKILPGYNVIYKNFISEDSELVSYNLGNKNIFDTAIPPMLDIESWYDQIFTEMSSYINCSSTKQNTLLNLSSPCK
jgi:spermidine/putrescine-binding protein